MGLLDLHLLLLPRTADSERRHVCVHWRAEVGISGFKPALPVVGLAGIAGRGRGAQYCRAGYRQVAAKCRRVSTYVPLLMLIGLGWYLAVRHGSTTHFDWKSSLP